MQLRLHPLAALAFCLYLAGATGCAATAENTKDLFAKMAGRKSPEQILNIKTPDDHVKELHELAKTAAKKSPEEQLRTTSELANELRNEQDPAMRRHVLRTLSAYPTPQAFALLAAGLQDSDKEVRRVACACLAKQGGAKAVPELARVVTSDTDGDVRVAAVRALGETKDKSALTPLAEALADSDPAMQFRANESLRAVSGRNFGNDVKAWREYAATGKAESGEVGLAERIRRAFY